MEVTDAQRLFRQRLTEAGVDPSNPSFVATWEVFKLFTTEAVDTSNDGLLFESGVYRFTGPERFTRQQRTGPTSLL